MGCSASALNAQIEEPAENGNSGEEPKPEVQSSVAVELGRPHHKKHAKDEHGGRHRHHKNKKAVEQPSGTAKPAHSPHRPAPVNSAEASASVLPPASGCGHQRMNRTRRTLTSANASRTYHSEDVVYQNLSTDSEQRRLCSRNSFDHRPNSLQTSLPHLSASGARLPLQPVLFSSTEVVCGVRSKASSSANAATTPIQRTNEPQPKEQDEMAAHRTQAMARRPLSAPSARVTLLDLPPAVRLHEKDSCINIFSDGEGGGGGDGGNPLGFRRLSQNAMELLEPARDAYGSADIQMNVISVEEDEKSTPLPISDAFGEVRLQSCSSLMSRRTLSSGSDAADLCGFQPFNDFNSGDASQQLPCALDTSVHDSPDRPEQSSDAPQTHGLATFCNRPRECAVCHNAAVTFTCEYCDDFFLCDTCRFDREVLASAHPATHAILSLQDHHCHMSGTFGDSVFSFSGDGGGGGASSLFYNPCTKCQRAIDDVEPVYRCEKCDYILCQDCFLPQQGFEDAVLKGRGSPSGWLSSCANASPLLMVPPVSPPASGTEYPHEHELKFFQRKPRLGSAFEGTLVNKSRNSDGNKIINDYVVVRQLGRGAYAKVKLVQHIQTQELFALKILRRQVKRSHLSGISFGRGSAKNSLTGTNEDDLLREIAVMKVVDHPNIVKLKEVIEDVKAQKVYVIMEYCERGPVHQHDSPPLPPEQARQYGADILRGILHLHSEFLYHRDIKPANCLVNRKGVAKIADFGTCNSQVRTKLAEGTPAFSSPEKVRGEEVSGEVADSWAFALTLCEMAYGTLPVPTKSFIQHRKMLLGERSLTLPSTGDPQLRDLLSKMLEKDLSKRLLASGAAQHPYFARMHVDARLGTLDVGQRPFSVSAAVSPSGVSPSHIPEHEQLALLEELYAKALSAVHRGKDLKNCFHGVRTFRRVRRKELDTARMEELDTDDPSDRRVEGSSSGDGGGDDRSESEAGSSEPGYNDDHNGEGKEGARAGHEAAGAAEAATTLVTEIVQQALATQEAQLEIVDVVLSHAATLERLNPLGSLTTEMRLSSNALTSVHALDFPSFTRLMDVVITFNRLQQFPEEVLAVPRLLRLDLSHNRITSIPASLVSAAPYLERLNLHNNNISAIGTTTAVASALPHISATSASEGHRSVVSVLAAPCLRHVRLTGNPLEHLPAALHTTHRLQLVLDAIPDVMEEWDAYVQAGSGSSEPRGENASFGTEWKSRLPAVIVWDDSFPVRIPGTEPPVWVARNALALYRASTLKLCKTRRVVLCQGVDSRFPCGLFLSDEVGTYFAALRRALKQRNELQLRQDGADTSGNTSVLTAHLTSSALPPILGKEARRLVESYFFVAEDENDEEGGYYSLVSYLCDSLSTNAPVLVLVAPDNNSSAVRTNIIAAISTALTRLRGGDPDLLDAEQAELIVSTMRSLYA